MSRTLTRVQAIILGAAVLVGSVLGVGGLFAIGSRAWPWRDAFDVRVGFAKINGVEVGTRVRVKGVDKGEVVAIELGGDPKEPVLLRLRLDGKLKKQQLLRADATAQIVGDGMLGGKVIEIDPGSPAKAPLGDEALLASQPTIELADALNKVNSLLQRIDDDKGKLGDVVDNTNKALKSGQDALKGIGQVADAVKRAPIVRNYVEDPQELLYRPGFERNRQVFAETELFEPGSARLTTPGRQRLNDLGPWLLGLTKHDGAVVTVSAFADSRAADATLAMKLTQEQAKMIASYLKDNGEVYKKLWVLSRDVRSVGLGVNPPPEPEKDILPPARIEVAVFVPQK
jgi:outer membrane protein OmpA-like peptidoglycan-associated protein